MRGQELLLVSAALLCVESMLNCSAIGFGGNNGTDCPRPVGADLICGDFPSFTANYAAEQIDGEWHDAFSFAYTVCNVGNADVSWQTYPSSIHPACAQSLFKMKNGRIEQIGASWVQHKITVLTGNVCGCGCNGHGGSVLGVGCSDPETASAAAAQALLTPRWQVNAHSGKFESPNGGGAANPPYSGTTARRLRLKPAELEPSGPSVKYFAEWLFVSAQEAALGNQNNNASYREATVAGASNEFSVAMTGTTKREQSAIRAWRASDPAVVETDIQLPDEGLFILAAKATDLGSGTWHYEYALANMNSDVSCQAFSVPPPPGAVVTNIGFHDVDYHSGDAIDNFTDPNLNISGADWQVTITNDSIQWSSEAYAQNINANALRWGTMYNFRFDANRPPASRNGLVTLSTYKIAGSVNAETVVPALPPCPSDIAPVTMPDGIVNASDLLLVINNWGPCVLGTCPADITGDGAVNVGDLLAVINSWGPCP